MDGAWTKMDEYRKQGLFVDVNFSVGGKDFKAHKVVLSCQSTVFEAMFTSGMEESQSGRVSIVDIKPDVFEVFLAYFYTHAMPESALKTHLEELMYCSDKYVVPRLTEVCSQYLEDNFTLVRRLLLADMYRLSNLKTRASEEIANFGWDRLTTGEWFEMFSDFRLTTEVLHFVMPSCLTKKWTITPHMWFPPPTMHQAYIKLPPLHLRNNGRPCEISLTLFCIHKTVSCSIEYHPQNNGPKVVEMSFEFSIGNEAHFCGKGDVWWDMAELESGDQEQSQGIFEHTFSFGDAIKNNLLEFSLTLKQWLPLQPGLPSHFDRIDSDSGDPETAVQVHVAGEIFELNKAFVCRKSEFFQNLMSEHRNSYEIQHIDLDAFRKMHHYLRTGVRPLKTEVDFPMILCARSLGLTNLLRYCEQILARSLDYSLSPEMLGRSIDLLIFANENDFELLRDAALLYIDCHLKEVIKSAAWIRLQDRPDLIFSIVQKILASNDPYWSDGPDSDIDCDSEAEVEAIMDRHD